MQKVAVVKADEAQAKANALFEAAQTLGLSAKQYLAQAKKAGVEEAAKALLAAKGVSERRKTFRTGLEESAIAFLLANPQASDADCEKVFDKEVVKFFGSLQADKASNTIAHKKDYLENYFSFGKRLLAAKK